MKQVMQSPMYASNVACQLSYRDDNAILGEELSLDTFTGYLVGGTLTYLILKESLHNINGCIYVAT